MRRGPPAEAYNTLRHVCGNPVIILIDYKMRVQIPPSNSMEI